MFVDATYTAFLVPIGIAFHFKAQYFSWYNGVDIAAGKPLKHRPPYLISCSLRVCTSRLSRLQDIRNGGMVSLPVLPSLLAALLTNSIPWWHLHSQLPRGSPNHNNLPALPQDDTLLLRRACGRV